MVYLLISHAIPYSALESPAMQEFVNVLIPDFKLPSRRTLGRRVREAYEELKGIVERQIGQQTFATISIDGWEDHQHCETLGITLKPLHFGSKPFLLKMTRQTERQVAFRA